MRASSNGKQPGRYPLWPPGFARHHRLLIVLLGVDLLLALGAAVMGWLGLWFLSMIFTAACVIYALLPALVLTVVWWRTRHRILTYLGAISASITLAIVLLVPATAAGYALAELQLRRSMRMADVIMRQLDAYREKHGAYPDSIQKLAELGVRIRLPRLAREDFYHVGADGKSFSLTIPDPTGSVFDAYTLNSERRQWEEED